MTSREPYEDPEDRKWRLEEERNIRAAEKFAINNPEFDFFCNEELGRFSKPKQVLGEYVRSQGFTVPLIDTDAEWAEAFDNGDAMIRSELAQDYDGLSGVLSSTVVGKDHEEYQSFFSYDKSTPEMRAAFNDFIRQNLRNGQLHTTDYMKQSLWHDGLVSGELLTLAGIDRQKAYELSQDYMWDSSRWRYVRGTHVQVFRDPTANGRYFFGIRPDSGYEAGVTIDNFGIDSAEIKLTSDRPAPVVIPSEIIEYYEAIRALPKFDTRQCPVLELKIDMQGTINFLQYYKTGHVLEENEQFALPKGLGVLALNDVRGSTPQDGEDVRLYAYPKQLINRMHNQGFYIGYKHENLKIQSLCKVGKVAVNDYLSFKDNHYNSAPLYVPRLALGVGWHAEDSKAFASHLQSLTWLVDGKNLRDMVPPRAAYYDVHVTMNGREATLESSWQPVIEDYQ